MLVLNTFCGHLTGTVKRALGDGKTDLAVIPGRMTSTLQPINLVLNKPFKDRVLLEYQKWTSGDNPKIPTGCLQRPPLVTVCGWVLSAWHSLPDSMVENAFKKCSISNSLYGTEDNALWEAASDTLVFRRQWCFV
ncbi:hypothetical protein HPB51_020315 [Rhipicephalus microplus]|uniref:DDE-1 domain-containing protein n=1 Tax=Rhipicephalus microplus TaxID=6941 RepID=A0A9J6DC16_RHIMP|nr:hypothetical protein HPB51_020315 [Rhipicephalus microplus]